MPVYVYACNDCDHQFEQHQSFSDDSLTVCPNCQASALRKVFNSVGIVFKGSGFYRTDSRSGGTSTVAKSEKPEKSGTKTAPSSSDSGSSGTSSNGSGSGSSGSSASAGSSAGSAAGKSTKASSSSSS